MHRQGDCLIRRFAIPDNAKPLPEQKEYLLQGSKATGHRHRVMGDVTAFQVGEVLYLRVGKGGANAYHEEHNPYPDSPLPLEKGDWCVTKQFEQGLGDIPRQVID